VACAVTDLAAVACIAAWTVNATVSWPVAAAVALVSCVRIVVVGRSAPRLLRPALA
jgi:hypothetical protein